MPIYVAPYRKRSSPKMGYSNKLITLDAFITESHNYQASVTSHPVEKGVNITDNIYNEPTELDIEAVISPYGIAEGLRGNPERADEAYRELMRLYNNRIPVRVYTGLTNYTNMAITSITIPRSKENSQTLRYNISFRKVRIVSDSVIDLDVLGEDELLGFGSSGETVVGWNTIVLPTVSDLTGSTPEDVMQAYGMNLEIYGSQLVNPTRATELLGGGKPDAYATIDEKIQENNKILAGQAFLPIDGFIGE